MARRAPAYVGSLIPGLQAKGLTANEALAELRSQGLGIRRQNFLKLWGASIKEGSLREKLSTGDVHATFEHGEVVKVTRPKARGFQFNVDLLAYDKSTGEFYFTPTAVVSDTLNWTRGEIIQMAAESLRAQIDKGRDSVQADILQGGHVTSVLERVPETEEVF